MKRFLCFVVNVSILAAMLSNVVYASEDLPWGVERIGGNIVWDMYPGDLIADSGLPAGQEIRAAVVDSGIDCNHPDLNSRIAGGANFMDGSGNITDDFGHGTLCAGVVAASDNGNGLVGVAPRVSLLIAKVYDTYNSPIMSRVIQGIRWSVDNGARVVSLSLGFVSPDQLLFNAVKYAHDHGALVVAASGNENLDSIRYPARYDPYVIAVGATDQNDNRWVYNATRGSNYGPEMDFAAPGQLINSTYIGGSYLVDSGTSLATPHVAGVAALFFSSRIYAPYDSDNDGQWDNYEVEQKMRDTALNLAGSGRSSYFGYGLINAWRANQRPEADITYDFRVDVSDIGFLNTHWHDPPYYMGDYDRRADINIDNRANLKDLGIIRANYGKTCP